VFLVGVHAAVQNPINFSAFVREVGMLLNTNRLLLYIFVCIFFFCSSDSKFNSFYPTRT
jgi:hypothetical protein